MKMGSEKYRKADASRTFEGELGAPPRGPLATAILALTGILLVMELGRIIGRFVLVVRRPVEVQLTNSSFELRGKTLMLGRILREHSTVLPLDGLVRATREIRYPSLPVYAGLLALALGSYLGVGLAVDGVRAASPSMLATGLLIALLGLALDFILSSLVPGVRGRARVLLVPRRGQIVCVQSVDPDIADQVLGQLVVPKRGVPSAPAPAPVKAERADHGTEIAEEDGAREA
jgi:hypothetical protein